MKYFLIDLENVHDDGIKGADLLDEDSCIVIFHSSSSDTISNTAYRILKKSPAEVRFQIVNVRTKNAMDFEMAVYAGQLMMNADTDKIIIISADNGFKAVIEAVNQRKQNMMAQYPTLLSAWYMCIREERIPTSKVRVAMNEVKKGILKKEKVRVIAARLSVNPIQYANVIYESGNDKRSLYRGMMHTFGRKKGLEVYRYLQGRRECVETNV